MGTPIRKLKERWMKEPGFREGYETLGPEFELASMLIEARKEAKLSQAELAKRMGTSQSTIARLESGEGKPSLTTLRRFAKATGREVRLTLVRIESVRGKRQKRAA